MCRSRWRRMALYRVCAILGGKLAFLRNWRVHQGNNQVVLDVADIVFHAVEVVIHRHQRIVGEFFQPILNRPCRPFPPADPNSGFRRGMQLDHDFHDFIEPPAVPSNPSRPGFREGQRVRDGCTVRVFLRRFFSRQMLPV